MPSTYTQNLGIELPATGEQANTWGLTVNRNMDTLDTAINGNVSLTAPPAGTPYQLIIDNGADSPVAANPVIVWTGPQTAQGTVRIDWESSRQHLYFMRNTTSGGYGLAFTQGSGAQFVLQGGYDAIIYTDGGGTGASVAAALANPQFGNLLATGNAQVNGNLSVTGTFNGILTSDAQGNVRLTGGLGVGNPSAVPDPLTINGLGVGGQLRLVYSNYGVILRNDASQFDLGMTAANSPYGIAAAWPLQINLVNSTVGLGGWGPDGVHGLNVPSIHTSSLAADGAISAGAGITVGGARSFFNSGDPFTIGLEYGALVNYVGTNSSGLFQVSNSGGGAILTIDAAGNGSFAAGLTANGVIHSLSGGVMFPNGTVQTTAATGFAPVPHAQSRSTNTAYLNSTGVVMIVVISMGMFANSSASAWIGAGSPSTEVAQVSNFGTSQSQTVPLVFVVPPGWVYQVNYSSTAPIALAIEYY